MKRDLDQKMLGLNGEEFSDKATLKTVVLTVLFTPAEGDDKIALNKKIEHYQLLQTINKGGVVDLSAEEITLIKHRAAKVPLSILALGRMCDMLEADAKE